MPALSTLQSWFQGAILHSRRTRGITEAVVIYLAASALVLGAGVVWQGVSGLYIGLAGLVFATAVQTAWLWRRSRAARVSVGAGFSGLTAWPPPTTHLHRRRYHV